jgi:hypothetical protein
VLRDQEVTRSRSQSVTLNAEQAEMLRLSSPASARPARGKNIKYLPYAFTEQGVAMLSTVLRSPRALQVNIEIMRAFVRLRQMLQGLSYLVQHDRLKFQFGTSRRVGLKLQPDVHSAPAMTFRCTEKVRRRLRLGPSALMTAPL